MWLPQMTVRRWMLAVALLALASEPLEMARRWYIYTQRAESYERRAEGACIRRKADDKFGIFRPELFDANGDMKPEQAFIFDILLVYYDGLARKYRYAAAHPWLTVESDRPIPGM